MSELPEKINVMKVATYDVGAVVNEMCNPNTGWINGLTDATPKPNEVTIEMVMEYIDNWVQEDFGSTRDLIFQDENGEDL
jgi:hypothetical protein